MCISLSVYLFLSLRAKKTGKIRIDFPILSFSAVFFSCISLLSYSPYYVFVLSFVVNAVFFADLPILLPSVGLSSLSCVIVRLGVFRGPEAKK